MASLYLNQTAPNPAWLSPALEVIKSAGLLPQDAGTPILDVDPNPPSTESQSIRATAGNDTATTYNDVHVQIWALAFATATASRLYLSSMGGTKGILIPAGAAMPISIGPGQQQPFQRAWDKNYNLTSSEPEIVDHLVNGQLHCCVLANVYHPQDATSAAIPDNPAGPGAMLDVAGNRHHAQRNMTIVAHPPGAMGGFMMYAANPDPEREADVRLQVAERAPTKLRPWELDELAALGPWIRRTSRVAHTGRGVVPGLEVVLRGEKRARPLQRAQRPLKDLEIEVEEGGGGPRLKFPMAADEARRMTFNATLPKDEFVLRIIDVAQTQGGKVVGGARVMLLGVPKGLLPRPPKGG